MADQPILTVRSDATLEVEPELAIVRVTVSGQDRDRATALERLKTRSAAILADVEAIAAGVEIETAGTRFVLQYKGDRSRERVDGYIAQVTHTLTFRDFAVLGDVLDRLGRQDTVDVAGPWWGLRPASDVYRRARVAAVQAAVQRAREYAGALGARLTGVVQVADVGLLAEGPSAGPPPMLATAAAAPGGAGPGRGPAEGTTLRLEPARQVVRAAVEARFTMSAPDLAELAGSGSPEAPGSGSREPAAG